MITKSIKNLLLFGAIFFVIVGCSMFSETSATNDAYVSGEIMNPLADEIVLFQKSTPLDTIELDSNNRFHYYMKDVESGLYSFNHGSENQILYLEPGDSTIIFANTIDFDESLYFSGRNAEKNNFLIDMFLLNEKNNDLILSYSTVKPETFALKTDSIREARFSHLKKLQKKNRFSDEFLSLAKSSIEFEFFDLRERYSYLLNKYYPDLASKIPEEFHSYRNKIDLQDEEMEHYYGYLRLIDNYLKNMAMEKCKNPNDLDCRDPYNYKNIRNRIALIDSLTLNPNIKNMYFNRLGVQGILCSENSKQLNSILQVLSEEELPSAQRADFDLVAAIQKFYFPGEKLPQINVISAHDQKKVNLRSIVNKPSIFYNWSLHSPTSHQKIHGTIELLQKEYPQIEFIGINIDAGEIATWGAAVEENLYPKNSEYQLDKMDMDKKYLKYFLSKLLFVDADGTIIKGNAKMNATDFKVQINKFLKLVESEYPLAGPAA